MRTIRLVTYSIPMLLLASSAFAQWGPNGAPVCTASNDQLLPAIAPDGSGGAFVAWTDYRSAPSRIFLQHITSGGVIAPGWPVDGLPVCVPSGAEDHAGLVPDGSGGVFVGWNELRPNGYLNVLALHFAGDGTLVPGWPATGLQLMQLIPGQGGGIGGDRDGSSGVLLKWEYSITTCAEHYCFSSYYTYVAHVTAGGTILGTTSQANVGGQVISDGVGGCYEARPGNVLSCCDPIEIARYNSSMTQQWDRTLEVSNGGYVQLVKDGAGGALLLWLSNLSPKVVRAIHYLPDGSVAPGWPSGGTTLVTSTGLVSLDGAASDGAGGAIGITTDKRSVAENAYAVRVLADGTTPATWAGGIPIAPEPVQQLYPAVATDGLGGAFFEWTDFRSSPTGQMFGIQFNGAGGIAPGWPVGGAPLTAVPTNPGSGRSVIAATQPGVAIAAWSDHPGSTIDIHAQQLLMNNAVAVEVSVVEAEPSTEGVRMVWSVTGAAAADVQRSMDGGPWLTLATLPADGAGRIAFEDHGVVPGARYGYRLATTEAGRRVYAGEAWVTVPSAKLALRGLAPDPADGPLEVSLALADANPARLELLDLAGRRVDSREVGGLGPGDHVVPLGMSSRPAPGVYLVRLTQDGRSIVTRGCILR